MIKVPFIDYKSSYLQSLIDKFTCLLNLNKTDEAECIVNKISNHDDMDKTLLIKKKFADHCFDQGDFPKAKIYYQDVVNIYEANNQHCSEFRRKLALCN